jgi:hypothetical protein
VGTSITGVATAAGNFSFTAEISETGGAISERTYQMRVHRSLAFRTKRLHKGRSGKSYIQVLRASGGKKGYTWSIAAGALPAGVSLDGVAGKISGTPAGAGVTNFTIRVTDSLGATTQQPFSLTIY